jgi:predicted ATPase
MADRVEQLLQAVARSTATEVPRVLVAAARATGSEEVVSELLASIIEPSILGLERRERRKLRKGTDYPRLLTRFVRSLCRRWVGGLVTVTLDDLQWCDEQSLATLLAPADRDPPLLLLPLGRSEASDRLPGTCSGVADTTIWTGIEVDADEEVELAKVLDLTP